MCCSPWSHKEPDITQQLNWIELDCGPLGSSVHGILHARILEWVAGPLSMGFSPTQGQNSGLPHCRWSFNNLSHHGSPSFYQSTKFRVMHDLSFSLIIPKGINHQSCGLFTQYISKPFISLSLQLPHSSSHQHLSLNIVRTSYFLALETKEITLYLFFSGLTLVVRKSFLVSLWMFSIYNEVMLLATCPRIKGKWF